MCNFDMNEKEGTVASQTSRPKKLNARAYKKFLKSMVRKANKPDLQKRNVLSQSDGNAERNGSNDEMAKNAVSPFSRSEPKRVDFLLRRVTYSGHEERSSSPEYVSQTNKGSTNISESHCNQDAYKLKEKRERSAAYECNSTTTTFVEYWVPVRPSNIQIEQYCGSLFSNASILSYGLKHDSTEVLLDILVSTRKCCDHPYLVDWSLRTSLTQDVPDAKKLDAEIRLSNKLHLLHKILLEIRERGLRVLILYQSLGGSGPISTGDILDDIIHEKFGRDSFVRIGAGISRLKRQSVLSTFNCKGSEKFVCLMETRACVPSIKLQSVDTVIFFNSDWNPMNDLRALQRINLESQFEQVKVLRLYSAYTVEEKILVLAKQGMSPEGNIIHIKQSKCHRLLKWGSSYLFRRLDELHNRSNPDIDSVASDGESFVEDVFLELSNILPNNEKSNICKGKSLVLEVEQTGGAYPRNISLHGEVALAEEMVVRESSHVFWMKLLEGRNPRWKYISAQSPRIRKSVQRFHDLLEPYVGPEKPSKKRRTEARSPVCQIPAIIRRRARNKLHRRNKRMISGGKRPVLTRSQAPMLGNPLSTELHAMLPLQNEAATDTLVEDLIRQLESSMQQYIGEVPLQTAHIASDMTADMREPSVSVTCQPPETYHVTQSEALQSASKSLQIELERLQKQKNEKLKLHEEMKLQTQMACKKEIDQIRKKYDMLLQNAEMACVEEIEVLETRYGIVHRNKSLAEVMMRNENPKDSTLSQVTTNYLMDQLMSQWPRSSIPTRAEQVIGELPTSSTGCPDQPLARSPCIADRQVISSPCMSPLQQEMMQWFTTNAETTRSQALADHGITEPYMDTTSFGQLPQAKVGLSNSLVPNPPIPLSRNLQSAGYGMRAPAPHLGHTWHPLPTITPNFLSPPSAGVTFSPVILQPVRSNVQPRPSPGLIACAWSSPLGLPLLRYR